MPVPPALITDNLFHSAIHAAQFGVWRWEAETGQITTGGAFYTLFGIQPPQRVDTLNAFLNLVHPEDRVTVHNTLNRMLESDAPLQVAFRPMALHAPTRLSLQGGVIFNNSGKRAGLSGIVRLTTRIATRVTEAAIQASNEQLEKRVAERTAALAASEQRLRASNDLLIGIANATPDLVAAIDTRFCYTAANESYRQNFKAIFGRDVTIGASMIDLLSHLPVDQSIAIEMWGRALRGEIVNETAEFGDPNLERRVYDLRFGPLRDRNGDIIGAAEIASEVTERQRIYDQLDAALQTAEAANATKLRFLGMVSHELRTPLTSIKGFLTTLLADDITWAPEQQREFLLIADEEADKLTALVEQLLDLSRLQAGHLQIKPRPIRLADIIDKAAAQIAFLSARHRLNVQVSPRLPLVQADPDRIAQVLANLVGNAAKFSPADSPILVTAQQVNDCIELSVADRGPGISPENQEAVFEAFRQIDLDNGRRSSGAGLGLAICKGLVEAHGGSIWVDSAHTPGTRIVFTLPTI
jgi:signal transduction histidine kinase